MYFWIAITVSAHSVLSAKIKDKDAGDFIKFTQSPFFIDKSLFIKAIFADKTRKMILAPSGFGKTTNLEMLKSFISIPVNKDGKPVNRNRTRSYRAFKKLKIFKDTEFFFQHFGKYPVIHIDLSDLDQPDRKSSSGRDDFALTFKKVMRIMAKAIHASFKEHNYLIKSPHLNDAEKKLLDRWCGEDSFPKMSIWEVQTSLVDLSRFLFVHYECTEVFALVDECDSLVRKAIFLSNEVELGHIVKLVSDQLVTLFKPENYVGGGLVTGVSLVAGVDLEGMSNLMVYRFLDDHPFVDFYGTTETEAVRLFERSKLNPCTSSVREVRSWYNGYNDRRGAKLYNPSSLTKCHSSGLMHAYRNATDISIYLGNAFAADNSIRKKIQKVVDGKSVHVKFSRSGSPDGILMLRQLLLLENAQTGVENLFFTYLFENGYFTFDLDKKSFVKVPNREVRLELEGKLG